MLQIFSHLLVGFVATLMVPLAGPAAPLGVGQPAPNFAVQSLDGQRTMRLSDFRGRRVLIFTWASW